ncbi:MAG: hypothetical protein J6S67_06400 [Methanobrevibacter sp.]|nr:hypothetical protein [Methanobrevibacter sp.]
MAISCSLNKDLLRSNTCGYSLPEVKDIYLANFADVVSAPVNYDCESGVTVSAITLASGATFYHIEPAKNSVTYTDELVVEDNGNKYRTHTLTFNIAGKYDKDMVCPVDALALGRFFVVVATADGEYLALGRTVGLEASEQSVAGGGDTNGITVTLSGNVTETAVPLAEAAITVVKGN